MALAFDKLKFGAFFVTLSVSLTAAAVLPALNAEQQAKADEAAARAEWTDKVGRMQLCRAQDAVAARFLRDQRKAGKETKQPVAAATCEDPGPFTPAPPLEASGAHSPAATAAGPPSTSAPHAEMQGRATR